MNLVTAPLSFILGCLCCCGRQDGTGECGSESAAGRALLATAATAASLRWIRQDGRLGWGVRTACGFLLFLRLGEFVFGHIDELFPVDAVPAILLVAVLGYECDEIVAVLRSESTRLNPVTAVSRMPSSA